MTRKKTTTRRKTTRQSKRRNTKPSPFANISLSAGQKILIGGIVVIFVTAVITLSLITPNQGSLTAWLSDMIWRFYGWGAVFIPIFTGSIGLYLILWGMNQPPKLPGYRLAGVAILFLVFEAFASMMVVMRQDDMFDYWQVATAKMGGGYLGGFIAQALTAFVGEIGAILILAVMGIIAAVLVSGITREDIGELIQKWRDREAYEDYYDPQTAVADQTTTDNKPRRIRINPLRGESREVSDPVQLSLLDTENEAEPAAKVEPEPKKRGRRRKANNKTAPASETPTIASPVYLGSNVAERSWTLPVIAEILDSGADSDTNNAAIREQVEIIEHTLESFGAPATVVEINQGPTVTQYGVEPNYLQMRNGRRTKVKVSKIAGLADDLTLALSARSVRIQAPVPGKGYVGIEVPNPAKALVSLRDVMESPAYSKLNSPLGVGLGQNVSGQAIVADLSKMPHVLVAGTTGSGKSVCVNGIIACLLLQNTPDELKLVMIDPKRVELTGYNGIPHLAAPVVVDMDRVISTLQWALREMDTRYKMFAQVGARNIIDYNKKVKRKKDQPHMPYIVIIIDELADLMMLAPEDTERAITRLAQMARATGIHMLIATQRPSVDVVTGLIKANFPARIAFAVASSTDSRVILDSTGAERLLGQGDMLFQSPDAPAPQRLQGCYVSDEELQKLMTYWQRARRFNVISANNSTADAKVKRGGTPPELRPTPPPPPSATATPPTVSASTVKPATSPPSAATSQSKRTTTAAATTATVVTQTNNNSNPQPKPKATPTASTPPDSIQQQPLWEALQEEAEKPQHVDELMPEAIALVRKLDKASTSLLQRRFRIGYTRAARMMDAMEEMNIIGPPTGTSKAREVLPVSGETPSDKTESLETSTVNETPD